MFLGRSRTSLGNHLLLSLQVFPYAAPVAFLVLEPISEVFFWCGAVLNFELFFRRYCFSSVFNIALVLSFALKLGNDPTSSDVLDICYFEEVFHVFLLKSVLLVFQSFVQPIWVLNHRHWI